jgi:hypothetical protein
MPSSRSVRFDATTKGPNDNCKHSNKRTRADVDVDVNVNVDDAPANPKQKKFRPNEDELDDIDDYEADQDGNDDNKVVPSEREMLEAKRQRRQGLVKQVVGAGESTHIDETTSLAADGIAIEPFHMRQEESDGTGYFDGDTYVFRKNPDGDEEPDAWLDSLTDENGKQSSGFAVSSTAVAGEDDDKQKPMDGWTKEELYSKILPFVSDTETVAQAVRRYGQLVKQNRGKQKSGNAGPMRNGPSQETQDMAKSCLNDLTGAANALLLKGEVDIYDTTRKKILSLLPKEVAQEKTTEKPAPARWEYMGNQDGETHGPYSTEQMIGWTQAGYFVGDQKVKIRTIREGALSTEDDLLADLMDDDDDDEERRPIKTTVRGEWVWSSEVYFPTYLQNDIEL